MATKAGAAGADRRPGPSPWPERPWLPVALLGAVASLAVAPAAWRGTGFYMDDWRDLARMQTVGVLRSSEASRFASRPGAWCVETVTYGLLRAHPALWVVLLTVIATATATGLWLLLARYTRPGSALLVSALWLLLPDHQSLRLFANVTPIATSLLLLVLGLLLFEHSRPNLATLALCMGISCYESAYLPAVAALLALHVLGRRGTRREAGIAIGLCTVVVALMAIHPTYPLGSARLGMPIRIVVGQLATGLTPSPAIADGLLAVLGVAVLVAVARAVAHPDVPVRGARLMAAGAVVIAIGLAGFAMRAPDDVRGFADRSYGVSSIGTALLWAGAIGVLAHRRTLFAAGIVAFSIVLGAATVSFQRDWSSVAERSDRALRRIDARYRSHPPEHLVVGPGPIEAHGVRSLHDFYIENASLIVTGHPFHVTICEDQAQWDATPFADRITWDELLEA